MSLWEEEGLLELNTRALDDLLGILGHSRELVVVSWREN
jgi:hypothetical protein